MSDRYGYLLASGNEMELLEFGTVYYIQQQAYVKQILLPA
jgi:hypothetical protein